MSNKDKRTGFSAGISTMIVVIDVLAVIASHGTSDPSKVTWGDIAWFLFVMAVFAVCVIDIYRYFQKTVYHNLTINITPKHKK